MMAELLTTASSQPGQWFSTMHSATGKQRDQARVLWLEAQPRTRTAVQMGALVAVTVIAYSYSLTTLLQLADLNSPLAYVSLVSFIALILAGINSRPRHPEPAIHDRQTDYIVGV